MAAALGRARPHQHQQLRHLVRVRLKWVKNRALDHVIDTETDLKAACLLKDAIKRSSRGQLSARVLAPQQRPLGLTIPVLRFLRRYPTLFHEAPDPRYSNLPCFRLTDTALFLDSLERSAHLAGAGAADRLARLLLMSKSRRLPLQWLQPLKWDLGLPDDYLKSLIPQHPERFKLCKRHDGLPCLELARWPPELAVSALASHISDCSSSYKDYKKLGGSLAMGFPMEFPRGYGSRKKVAAWMSQFQQLPYISPYEDSSEIDPSSELMEKHVVGVLHEVLSLMLHRKTKRNYLRPMREELNLPHKFTRVFTRYPGVFYLSLKCKTTTVVLKEGYRKGRLVAVDPLVAVRRKFYYVMRTGVMYRGKGVAELEGLKGDELVEEGESEEGGDSGDECEVESGSEFDTGSDDD